MDSPGNPLIFMAGRMIFNFQSSDILKRLSEIIFEDCAYTVVCYRVCLVDTAVGVHLAVACCCGLVLYTNLHCIMCICYAG